MFAMTVSCRPRFNRESINLDHPASGHRRNKAARVLGEGHRGAAEDAGIARAYAGHADNTGPTTPTYIRADIQAVARVVAALTGEPHPLALSSEALGFLS